MTKELKLLNDIQQIYIKYGYDFYTPKEEISIDEERSKKHEYILVLYHEVYFCELITPRGTYFLGSCWKGKKEVYQELKQIYGLQWIKNEITPTCTFDFYKITKNI